jgi:hypothetical protein
MSPADRQRLIDETVAHYREVLERRLAEEPTTIDAIEQTVEEIGQEMDRVLEQQILDQLPPEGNQATCPDCRAPARFRCVVPRQLLTSHGLRQIACRYYYCARCRQGCTPREARLGLDGSRLTRQVRSWIAKRAAKMPFAEVVEDLQELRALTISASSVERTTLAVGEALRAAEAAGAGPSTAPPPELRTRRLYLSMDGVFCPLREPWKKNGSLGALQCRFGECKVGTAFITGTGPAGDEGVVWRAYTATLEKVEGFSPRMLTLAQQAGADTVSEVIALADGAEWIWAWFSRHYPRALQILDYYHMTQHLYAVAHARFGTEGEAARAWVHTCQAFLEQDRVAHVLLTIGNWEPEKPEHQEVRDREYAFFANNAERVRYGTFLRRGYQIGSGAMESGCRQVVTQRLDEAGMHWREETADAVVRVRAAVLSTDRPDLRQYCGLLAA